MAFKSLEAGEAAQTILTAESPIIFMHARPDADTVGTACALAEVFRALGKNPRYACSDKIPKRLEFIINDLPRAENFENSTLISVDVASPMQLGELVDFAPRISLMIDHHELGEPFAPSYIVKGASSAAEALYDIICELVRTEKIILTKKIAEPLFTAICSDTGSFRYSSASARTFRIAAELLELGVDHSEIAHKLFCTKTSEQLRAEGYIASKIRLFCDGKIAVATHTCRERAALGTEEEHFECAIDVVREVAGVEISAVIRETEKGTIKASLRSTGADVATVAAKFRGGGHVRAAGCSPEAKSVKEALDMLLPELMKLI